MEEVAAEFARTRAELTRRQRQAQKERARRRKQREHALLTATIAFCHEPAAGPVIAAATLRKYTEAIDEEVDALTRDIETRFLETPVNTLAQWLEWSDMPRPVQCQAQRLVEETRLLQWIGQQNSAQGDAPAPQFLAEEAVCFGHRPELWPPEVRIFGAPGQKRCGRENGSNAFESAATCASAVCLPRRSCRRRKCNRKHDLRLPKNPHRWSDSGGPFWVRNTDPVLGPRVCFQLKRGAKKRTRFGGRILAPDAPPVGLGLHFPARTGTTWPPSPAAEPGRDFRQVLV